MGVLDTVSCDYEQPFFSVLLSQILWSEVCTH